MARTGDVGRGNAPSPYLQQRQRLGDSYRDSTEQHNAAQMVTDDNRTGRALQGDARDWGERFEPYFRGASTCKSGDDRSSSGTRLPGVMTPAPV